MWTLILKRVVSSVTVIVAIGYTVVMLLKGGAFTAYQTLALSLLTMIATSFLLDSFDDERKWKEIERKMVSHIASVSDCRIQIFDTTDAWVEAMRELTKDGNHIFVSASLDKTTRSKAKKSYSSIWQFLEDCSKESRINFRQVLRIRKNNFENLLNRMLAGGANKNSYFGCYSLPDNFSFPTFGIIDDRYVVTRSPYEQGETPCYMIIDNQYILNYFRKYYDDLWMNSEKVDSSDKIDAIYQQFCDSYNDAEKKTISDKIAKLKKEGIIDDI